MTPNDKVRWLIKSGMKQVEIARRLGLSNRLTVWRWVRGDTTPEGLYAAAIDRLYTEMGGPVDDPKAMTQAA